VHNLRSRTLLHKAHMLRIAEKVLLQKGIPFSVAEGSALCA
jgi:hypothetical protein